MSMLKNPIVLYGSSFLVVCSLAFILNTLLPKTTFMYTFLFNSWQIQFLSTWLFIIGILFWVQRFMYFRKENAAFTSIKIPDTLISRQDVPVLFDSMPKEYESTLTLRRIKELLLALKFGEDILRLNEELSRRDMADVERGHLTLDILRNLIPVIGFLGTVIGLSLAMVAFPQVTDPTALKNALKDFAASLSVAFNTTLLALAYTIGIIMLASFLRQREESLVSEVDSTVRALINKLNVTSISDDVKSDGKMKLDEKGLDYLKDGIVKAITDVGNSIIMRMEGLNKTEKS